MTSGRDEDSPKPRPPALPHVRYHPSIHVPESSRTRSHSRTKEIPNGGTRLNGAETNLPHVWYHPSIRTSAPGTRGSDGGSEGFQMTTPQKDSNTADSSCARATGSAGNARRRSGQKKAALPEVQVHPSIKTSDRNESEDSSGVRPDGGAAGSPQSGVTGRPARRRTRQSGDGGDEGERSNPGVGEDGDLGATKPQKNTRKKTEKPGNPRLDVSAGAGEEAESVSDRELLELLEPTAPPGDLLDQDLVEQVEVRTRGQRLNPDWFSFRRHRITASVAHSAANSRFANGKSSTPPASYVRAILGNYALTTPTSHGESGRVQTRAMAWGVEHEAEAVRRYQEQQSAALGLPLVVQDCGLFIDPTRPWLAASPDGIVTDGRSGRRLRCLEVKCPFKHRGRTVAAAAREDRLFCLQVVHQEGAPQLALKRSHQYFTQVQVQLAVTGLKMADFVVFTERDLAVVPVRFDPDFWEETVTKLERFYRDAVMPALRGRDQELKGQGQEPRGQSQAWSHEP